MKVVAFYNPKSGSGTTSLVYHLAHMFARLGVPTLAVDLDPQADLTEMFLDEETIVHLSNERLDVSGTFTRWLSRKHELVETHVEHIQSEGSAAPLGLLTSDLFLEVIGEYLSRDWLEVIAKPEGDRKERRGVLRRIRQLSSIIEQGARSMGARLVLLDVAPGAVALARTALLNADYFVVPIDASTASAALRSVSIAYLREEWTKEWHQFAESSAPEPAPQPPVLAEPIGYVMQSASLGRPHRPMPMAHLLARWPRLYRSWVLGEVTLLDSPPPPPENAPPPDDPYRLGVLRYLGSLLPLAQEARKPVFDLKPADGALGSLSAAAVDSFREHRELALRIAERCGIKLPGSSASTPTGQDDD